MSKYEEYFILKEENTKLKKKVKDLENQMTKKDKIIYKQNTQLKEKEFLKNHTFNEIWDNLWIKVTNQSERIKNVYV